MNISANKVELQMRKGQGQNTGGWAGGNVKLTVQQVFYKYILSGVRLRGQ